MGIENSSDYIRGIIMSNEYYKERVRRVKGFRYKDTSDPKYIKDKDDFFREGGNGWWIKEPYKKK